MTITITPYKIGIHVGHIVTIDHGQSVEYVTSFNGSNSKVEALTYAAALAADHNL